MWPRQLVMQMEFTQAVSSMRSYSRFLESSALWSLSSLVVYEVFRSKFRSDEVVLERTHDGQ